MTYRGIRAATTTALLLSTALIDPRSAVAVDSDGECETRPPLIVLEWDSLSLDKNPDGPVGEWQFPLSPSHPDVITHAQVALRMSRESAGLDWKAQLHFSFPDPKPYGIPFTFQKAELSWATPEGTLTHRLDWSNACTSPGRGLYPRQEWKTELELSGTREAPELLHPVLRIWGSRN